MLVYLASFKSEFLLTKMFLFIPSRMNQKTKERKVYPLREAGLGIRKPHTVLGRTLPGGTSAMRELVH